MPIECGSEDNFTNCSLIKKLFALANVSVESMQKIWMRTASEKTKNLMKKIHSIIETILFFALSASVVASVPALIVFAFLTQK